MTKHDAIKHLSHKISYAKSIGEKWAYGVHTDALEIAVRAMAEEPKKGKWILADEQREEDVSNGNYQFYCSECGHGDLQSKSVTVSFCWNCGARMSYEEAPDAEIY